MKLNRLFNALGWLLLIANTLDAVSTFWALKRAGSFEAAPFMGMIFSSLGIWGYLVKFVLILIIVPFSWNPLMSFIIKKINQGNIIVGRVWTAGLVIAYVFIILMLFYVAAGNVAIIFS